MKVSPGQAVLLLRNAAAEVSNETRPYLVLAALELLFRGPRHFLVLGDQGLHLFRDSQDRDSTELADWLAQSDPPQFAEFRSFQDRNLFVFPLTGGIGGGECQHLSQERLEKFSRFYDAAARLLEEVTDDPQSPLERWQELRRMGLEAAQKEDWPTAALFSQAALDRVLNVPELVLAAAKSYNDLAHALWRNGFPEWARECLQDGVQLFEMHAHSGPDDLAACYNDLGGLLMDLNELDQAQACYLKAIEILETIDLQHPGLVPVLCNASYYYHKTGQEKTVALLMKRAEQLTGSYPESDPRRLGFQRAYEYLN